MKVFVSYNFTDEIFVSKVIEHLKIQEKLELFYWTKEGSANKYFMETLKKELGNSKAFLLFVGQKLGKTQTKEANAAFLGKINKFVLVKINRVNIPNAIAEYSQCPSVTVKNKTEIGAIKCAKEIIKLLHISDNEIPDGYPFDYEKSIISEYLKGKGELSNKRVEQGCPREWPKVKRNKGKIINKVEESIIGIYRDWDKTNNQPKTKEPEVVPAALTEYHSTCLQQLHMTFPEAGPRKYLYYPNRTDKSLTVGVLVSGGIAPGINAVIDGIVSRQYLYARELKYSRKLSVIGYINGFDALLQAGSHYQELDADFVAEIANTAGSIIGSSRAEKLVDPNDSKRAQALDQVAQRLLNDGVDVLYIIGGHGSMRAAHAIWKATQEKNNNPDRQLSIIAIPKTMDNDILWVWQSFGFMSAVEKAKELIGYMYTEVKSNPGLCIIQLFGSDSGFVSSHAVLSSGLCDLCLIPEVPFTMDKVSEYIKQKLEHPEKVSENIKQKLKLPDSTQSPYGIIVMSEAAVPRDAKKYIDDPIIDLTSEEKKEIFAYLKKGRLPGHTPDPLRRATLKIVSRVLAKNIQQIGEQWENFRVITNEPKHQIRAIPPSPSDIIFGRRLGSLAVDCAMAGYTDFMISQWLTEYVMVPLRLVILGRKRVPQQGIFWNSVRHSTGQPEKLD